MRQRLNPSAPSITEESFEIVLTNPPFGATDSVTRILERYEMGKGKSEKREVLLLERCIRLLRPGGRMAVVIPEGILSNVTAAPIRRYIAQHCIVNAVIRLPQDAFAMSEGAACTSILYLHKKDPNNESLKQGPVFFARAEYIGVSPSGKPIDENDLIAIRENYRLFEEGKWDGIELEQVGENQFTAIRTIPNDGTLWLEPAKNRTSLLYDRLSFVVRNPNLEGRYGYTYFHPEYQRVMSTIERSSAPVCTLSELCINGYPTRGRKPQEESSDGIPILKVRNVTGNGIDTDTEFAPDTESTRESGDYIIIKKNDVLITCTGEGTIGRVDIYQYDEPAIADGHIAICRFREDVNPQYVLEYLRGEYGQIQMLRHISGSTGQTELLIRYVEGLRIPKPDLDIQDQIVSRMMQARERATALLQEAEEIREQGAQEIAAARQEMYGVW